MVGKEELIVWSELVSKAIEVAFGVLEKQKGRSPTATELAGELGVPVEMFNYMAGALAGVNWALGSEKSADILLTALITKRDAG